MADTAVIFVEFGVLVTLLVTVMSCICCRNKHKNSGHDPENKPQDRLNNNKNLQETNLDNGEHIESDEMEHLDPVHLPVRPPNRKIRNQTTPLGPNQPRELPELPPGEVMNHDDNTSDLNYARVSDLPRASNTSISSLHSIDTTMHVHSSSDNMINVTTYDANAYATVKPSPLRHSQNVIETPPPVPEKHFEQGEPSSVASSNLSAASAVAGIADIPYMTSPAWPVPDSNNQENDFIYDGNQQTPCYTSISVREPLENIKSQIPRPEPTYSSVPDDCDQVYAEIQPERTPHGLYPPAPPTVESLKNVAQAQHSRQASCSSFTASDAASLHSPTFERNLNHSSWGAQPTVEEPSSLYSVIDKPKKQLEDLYATVQKPKQSANGHEPSHHANLHGVRNNGCDSKSAKGNSLVRRSSSKDDPNYEKILDTTSQDNAHDPQNFKVSRTNGASNHGNEQNGSDPGYETMPGSKRFGDYETIPDGYTCNSDEENEPGYEQVPMPYQRPYPDYERVDYAVNNSMGMASPGENTYWQISARGEANDPFYEKIARLDDDPNYEKVKTASEQSDEESTEPGYEQVKHSTLSQNTYEKVRDGDELLNFDPGYEKIHDNRVELRVKWNGDATPGDGSSRSAAAHLHHVPLASNSSDYLPDFGSPFTPSGDSTEPPYAPLSSINRTSTYNTTIMNYDDQACNSASPSEYVDNSSVSSDSFKNERHDSLL